MPKNSKKNLLKSTEKIFLRPAEINFNISKNSKSPKKFPRFFFKTIKNVHKKTAKSPKILKIPLRKKRTLVRQQKNIKTKVFTKSTEKISTFPRNPRKKSPKISQDHPKKQ